MIWTRSNDERGTTVYESGEWMITSYGSGDFGVGRAGEELSFTSGERVRWAESLVEAKVLAEYLSIGGDAEAHRTRTSHSRSSVPPRGSWVSLWKWRCNCGAKSSGGLDRVGAISGSRDHRIAAMQKWIDAEAVA